MYITNTSKKRNALNLLHGAPNCTNLLAFKIINQHSEKKKEKKKEKLYGQAKHTNNGTVETGKFHILTAFLSVLIEDLMKLFLAA